MTDSAREHPFENPFEEIVAATGDRRSFLQFGAAGLAAAAVGANQIGGSPIRSRKQRSTERLIRRFLRVVESGSTSAIWALFAEGGAIEFPFLGTRYTDFASFDAAIGPVLAQIPDLTFSDLDVEFLEDPEALIAKFRGHATVTFTGKPYDQTYIVEFRTRNGRVTLWAEYFDTAVLNEAFTP